MATFYPHEGHHFVYERWREILGVIVAEMRGRAGAPQEPLNRQAEGISLGRLERAPDRVQG